MLIKTLKCIFFIIKSLFYILFFNYNYILYLIILLVSLSFFSFLALILLIIIDLLFFSLVFLILSALSIFLPLVIMLHCLLIINQPKTTR